MTTPIIFPTTLPPALHRGAQPNKRGAQPLNTNARKHGFYSKRNPNAIQLNLTLAIQHTKDARAGLIPIHEASSTSKRLISSILDQSSRTTDVRTQLLDTRLLIKAFDQKASLLMLEHKRTAGPRRLLALSENASKLISLYKTRLRSWEQQQLYQRLPGEIRQAIRKRKQAAANRQPSPCTFIPVSFKDLQTLTTYNGLPASPVAFLNDRHWHTIQVLFDSLHQEHNAILVRRKSRPLLPGKSRATPYPDRFLLDGILWKLATETRWADLPAPYPTRRCQQLYRQLCQTGRMTLILNQLHEDLHAYGDTRLETLALFGKYILYRNRILFITKTPPTWQELIALLLLQCGQKTVLRLQRLYPPRFSERRLPGYRPGLLRSPGLRWPRRRVHRFVPPTLSKKDTLTGYYLLKIPPPVNHPTMIQPRNYLKLHIGPKQLL
jgi:transposase